MLDAAGSAEDPPGISGKTYLRESRKCYRKEEGIREKQQREHQGQRSTGCFMEEQMPLKGLQPVEDPCQSTVRSKKEQVAERTCHVLTAALLSHSLAICIDGVSLNTHISN